MRILSGVQTLDVLVVVKLYWCYGLKWSLRETTSKLMAELDVLEMTIKLLLIRLSKTLLT